MASRNRPGWHIRLAVGAIDRPVQTHDAAEGADRITFVRTLEALAAISGATAAPQGLLCLRMHAAGKANWRISRNALSRSSRLLYESSFPCRSFAVARLVPPAAGST